MDLTNASVAITGASRGIGAAAAKAFAKLGAHVFLAARDQNRLDALADEINADGGNATAIGCDTADYLSVSDLIADIIESTGRLDVLINNAGLIEPISKLADSDPDEWCRVADVNYKGVYFGLRAALPHMLHQGQGIVINVSSGAASGALEGWSHYCSSKAAALSLTRCAHLEYADQGIRVVGLSPGTVATDMQVAIKASGINPVSQMDPSAHIPGEWVARAMIYLCGDGGAQYAGDDFRLGTDAARAQVGLPPKQP